MPCLRLVPLLGSPHGAADVCEPKETDPFFPNPSPTIPPANPRSDSEFLFKGPGSSKLRYDHPTRFFMIAFL